VTLMNCVELSGMEGSASSSGAQALDVSAVEQEVENRRDQEDSNPL